MFTMMNFINYFSTNQFKFLKLTCNNAVMCFVNVAVQLNGSTCTAMVHKAEC